MSHPVNLPARSTSQDLMASLVVFLIALPLSLGIALASGAPPVAAIVAAIVGGAVVGLISGAPLVVTGPAAGLSAMVLQYVQSYGLERLFQITLLAGILQTVFAALRFARIIQRIPKTVVEGVLSAIGFTIVLGQLHIILGQKIPGSAFKNIMTLPQSMLAAVPADGAMTGFHAQLVGLVAVFTILAWGRYAKKLNWLPAALPGVIAATVFSLLFQEIPRMSVSPLGAYIKDAVGNSTSTAFWTTLLTVIVPALGLAIVASAESLLTTRSIDVLATKKHIIQKADVDRELLAQGIGNAISGFFGGLPLTGVMVRSAANLEAGARTRLSTIMHSVWIAVFVFFAPKLLSVIPLAALAAILIITGIKLINFHHMYQAMKSNPKEAWLWPATAVAVVSTDLLKGLTFGLVAAIIAHFVPLLFRPAKPKESDISLEEAK
ncbi:MAG: SulP family inorganic anion transporter [Proteobacteria bacterium]|nr:SulP family inorganic anion transporter [Pseudomonadota bacterium]